MAQLAPSSLGTIPAIERVTQLEDGSLRIYLAGSQEALRLSPGDPLHDALTRAHQGSLERLKEQVEKPSFFKRLVDLVTRIFRPAKLASMPPNPAPPGPAAAVSVPVAPVTAAADRGQEAAKEAQPRKVADPGKAVPDGGNTKAPAAEAVAAKAEAVERILFSGIAFDPEKGFTVRLADDRQLEIAKDDELANAFNDVLAKLAQRVRDVKAEKESLTVEREELREIEKGLKEREEKLKAAETKHASVASPQPEEASQPPVRPTQGKQLKELMPKGVDRNFSDRIAEDGMTPGLLVVREGSDGPEAYTYANGQIYRVRIEEERKEKAQQIAMAAGTVGIMAMVAAKTTSGNDAPSVVLVPPVEDGRAPHPADQALGDLIGGSPLVLESIPQTEQERLAAHFERAAERDYAVPTKSAADAPQPEIAAAAPATAEVIPADAVPEGEAPEVSDEEIDAQFAVHAPDHAQDVPEPAVGAIDLRPMSEAELRAEPEAPDAFRDYAKRRTASPVGPER